MRAMGVSEGTEGAGGEGVQCVLTAAMQNLVEFGLNVKLWMFGLPTF